MDYKYVLPLTFILTFHMLTDFIVSGESKDEPFYVEPGAGTQSFESKMVCYIHF